MSRLFQSVDFNSISSCSSESDENDSSSEDDETEERMSTKSSQTQSDDGLHVTRKSMKSQNILLKLYNRERTGFFSDCISHKDKKLAFARVPKRLSFCLKEIVPYCYLTGHVFMGLTICGQFMLSYKIISDEDSTENNYSFTSTYKYELYFWIYRPHNLLCKYYMICLFDDHGVDNIKTVTMAQWKSNPRILIVHGAGGYENEDSYVTIVAVPNLCCLDCKQQRDDYYSDLFDSNRCGFLCIKCNLTIHTKYCRADSDPAFNPYVSLQCIDKILIVANGLIHIVHADLDLNRSVKPFATSIDIKYIQDREKHQDGGDTSGSMEELNKPSLSTHDAFKCPIDSVEKANREKLQKTLCSANDNESNAAAAAAAAVQRIVEPKNIVDKIIADFAECETDPVPNEKYMPSISSGSHFNELVITCSGSSGGNNNTTSTIPKPSNSYASSNRVRLLNHRSNRIISKNIGSMKNGITKIELNPMLSITGGGGGVTSAMATNKNLDQAAKAYEFSEDNEKCEKISTFRKRRLADKKYEFCEDNTENIIPYTKMRSVIRNPVLYQKFSKQSPVHSNYFSSSSPPSTFDMSMSMSASHHTHRASPSYGFRSPCGSPVGNRFMMMSPPARSCFGMKSPSCTRATATMSPRSQPSMKRPYYDSLLENNLILSPRSDDCDNNIGKPFVQPLSEMKPSNIEVRCNQLNAPDNKNSSDTDKPMCSIKLIRRYVEEDDAASVITSEEDDCISPGYHTSLPLEVHGAGYSDMQMISKMSYKKLLCPTVTVTQTTFDLEAFTYNTVNYLCSINNKKYGFFFDCACEIVKICPLSCVLTCILMAHFTASDLQPDNNIKNCTNCSSSLNLDCAFHRKHYECQILFTWDIDTGEWNVLDYGNMFEVSPTLANGKSTSYIHRIVSKLAADMISGLTAYSEIFNNLHVLDSCVDKSKKVLKDFENSIAFYRTAHQNRYAFSDASDID